MGPVLFGDVNCNGTESSLADCDLTRAGRFLFRRGHSNDAGVRCQHVTTQSGMFNYLKLSLYY